MRVYWCTYVLFGCVIVVYGIVSSFPHLSFPPLPSPSPPFPSAPPPLECLEYLLRAGCGVHSRVSGGTALHYAASGGHTQCAQLLIEAGVDINALVGTEEVRGMLPGSQE